VKLTRKTAIIIVASLVVLVGIAILVVPQFVPPWCPVTSVTPTPAQGITGQRFIGDCAGGPAPMTTATPVVAQSFTYYNDAARTATPAPGTPRKFMGNPNLEPMVPAFYSFFGTYLGTQGKDTSHDWGNDPYLSTAPIGDVMFFYWDQLQPSIGTPPDFTLLRTSLLHERERTTKLVDGTVISKPVIISIISYNDVDPAPGSRMNKGSTGYDASPAGIYPVGGIGISSGKPGEIPHVGGNCGGNASSATGYNCGYVYPRSFQPALGTNANVMSTGSQKVIAVPMYDYAPYREAYCRFWTAFGNYLKTPDPNPPPGENAMWQWNMVQSIVVGIGVDGETQWYKGLTNEQVTSLNLGNSFSGTWDWDMQLVSFTRDTLETASKAFTRGTCPSCTAKPIFVNNAPLAGPLLTSSQWANQVGKMWGLKNSGFAEDNNSWSKGTTTDIGMMGPMSQYGSRLPINAEDKAGGDSSNWASILYGMLSLHPDVIDLHPDAWYHALSDGTLTTVRAEMLSPLNFWTWAAPYIGRTKDNTPGVWTTFREQECPFQVGGQWQTCSGKLLPSYATPPLAGGDPTDETGKVGDFDFWMSRVTTPADASTLVSSAHTGYMNATWGTDPIGGARYTNYATYIPAAAKVGAQNNFSRENRIITPGTTDGGKPFLYLALDSGITPPTDAEYQISVWYLDQGTDYFNIGFINKQGSYEVLTWKKTNTGVFKEAKWYTLDPWWGAGAKQMGTGNRADGGETVTWDATNQRYTRTGGIADFRLGLGTGELCGGGALTCNGTEATVFHRVEITWRAHALGSAAQPIYATQPETPRLPIKLQNATPIVAMAGVDNDGLSIATAIPASLFTLGAETRVLDFATPINAAVLKTLAYDIDASNNGHLHIYCYQAGTPSVERNLTYTAATGLWSEAADTDLTGWLGPEVEPRTTCKWGTTTGVEVVFSKDGVSFNGVLKKQGLVYAFGQGVGGWATQTVYPRFMADVDGDGYDDIVGFGSAGVYVSMAIQGNPVTYGPMKLARGEFGTAAGGWYSQDVYPRFMGDVTGDGKADVVGFGAAGVYVSASKSVGTTPSFAPATLYIRALGLSSGGWSSQNLYPRFVFDMNLIGGADVIGIAAGGVYGAISGYVVTIPGLPGTAAFTNFGTRGTANFYYGDTVGQ
jgi:hypothetical protein